MQRSDPIVKISEPGRTSLHLVVRRPVEVGRDCDGVLLADIELSRRHLRLSATAGRVTVQDLGSTNGTTLDGTPIVGPTGVRAGEVVRFGHCTLEVVAGNGTVAAAPSFDALRQTSIDLVADAAVSSGSIPRAVPEGGTLTIVFSDIEQSTRRAVELGDERWLELLGFHNNVIRRHLERHGGYEVKSQGDGFMLAFSSARSALLCSIDVMRALENHARSRPTDALRIRIGMHTGEAIIEDGDLFGKPVVLAARIANQACGGEILVSSLVREIVESRGDLAFGDSRSVELKGLSGAHTLHAVDWVRSRRGT
ncbi:MAG: FHA domain-containing protein [Actinomycetota bacterium]|nr:FHA domain-containing protein [Actinomycetota bacterium]